MLCVLGCSCACVPHFHAGQRDKCTTMCGPYQAAKEQEEHAGKQLQSHSIALHSSPAHSSSTALQLAVPSHSQDDSLTCQPQHAICTAAQHVFTSITYQCCQADASAVCYAAQHAHCAAMSYLDTGVTSTASSVFVIVHVRPNGQPS